MMKFQKEPIDIIIETCSFGLDDLSGILIDKGNVFTSPIDGIQFNTARYNFIRKIGDEEEFFDGEELDNKNSTFYYILTADFIDNELVPTLTCWLEEYMDFENVKQNVHMHSYIERANTAFLWYIDSIKKEFIIEPSLMQYLYEKLYKKFQEVLS